MIEESAAPINAGRRVCVAGACGYSFHIISVLSIKWKPGHQLRVRTGEELSNIKDEIAFAATQQSRRGVSAP